MSRTNDLKSVVQTKLESKCAETYFEIAKADAGYPRIVYSINRTNANDGSRKDSMINIDIWDQGRDSTQIDNLADSIEDEFDSKNEPKEHILPTFYLVDRVPVPDEDKKIMHRLISVQAQNYER